METFDVFDTVLTRNVGDPHTIFLRVGRTAVRRGLIKISATEFKRLRVAAETEARRKRDGGEVTLEDIYNCLAGQTGLGNGSLKDLRELELECEAGSLKSVKMLEGTVANARRQHGAVAYFSDMYLPRTFLEEILRRRGLFKDGDHLLVSGEQGVSKQTGKLYESFLGQTGLRPGQLLHCGDNWHSDVKMPRRLGIMASHFAVSALNRYEQILERHSEATDGVTSYLAGASRLVRLDAEREADGQEAIRAVAGGVAGPALLAFVMQILRRAAAEGLQRLYFLARDGQILLKLARLAAPVTGFRGELKYLFASRQALRLPTTDLAEPESLCWSLDNTTYLSVGSYLNRVGLKIDGTEALLQDHGLDPGNPQENLDKESRRNLADLVADSRFRELLAPVVERRRRSLVEYLKQEGVLGNEPFGIVDLGWHGSLQAALERVLKDSEALLPVGFYFGLSRRATDIGLGKHEAFFFDEGLQTGCVERDYWVEPMLEVFCAADHGMTLEYESQHGRVAPVLKEKRNEPALSWGLVSQQAAILKFAGYALESCEDGFDPIKLRSCIHELLGTFWNSPTREEAEAWGSYPYADDQTEAKSLALGEPFGVIDWLRSVYRGKITPPHRAGWAAGGLQRSFGPIQWTLPATVKLASKFRRLSGLDPR